ncbi:hypothetical protein ES703_27548 [subsurface metagenome]
MPYRNADHYERTSNRNKHEENVHPWNVNQGEQNDHDQQGKQYVVIDQDDLRVSWGDPVSQESHDQNREYTPPDPNCTS